MFDFASLDPNITGNVIGSFIAVCGAIAVLFLSEWWRSRTLKNEKTNNFLRELEYLQTMLKECKNSVGQLIEMLSIGTTNLYFNYNSGNILTQASQQAYQEGLLYENLAPEQLARFNSEVLTFFGNNNFPIENHINDQIKKWQEGEISTEELYQTFVWLKDKADDAVKLLKKIESDFKKSTNDK